MTEMDTQLSARSRTRSGPRFTLVGGVLAMCGGVGHVVLAALMRRDVWSQIVDEGFFNTVTLEPSGDRLAVAEAFWFSPGSFGVPLLLLGALVTWLNRRGQRVPGFLGWGVALWAVLLGLLGGFDTGTLILLLIGILLAVGDRRTSANKRAAKPMPVEPTLVRQLAHTVVVRGDKLRDDQRAQLAYTVAVNRTSHQTK